MKVYYGKEYEIDTLGELRTFVGLMIDEGYDIFAYKRLDDFLSDN
jgi:hypothetical protein